VGADREQQTRGPGDWICTDHDLITPVLGGPVPACPHCGKIALQATLATSGAHLVYAEPAPERCAGPDHHPLGPNRVNVGWHACECSPVVATDGRGHRTWTCSVCDNVQEWPYHRAELH